MSFLTAYLAQLDKPAKAPKAVQAKKPSVSKAAQLQALAALEEARHQQLCQLLEHTLPNHCDDYLRQLATTAVQVRTMAEIATLQAQLLQQQGKPPQPVKPRKSR